MKYAVEHLGIMARDPQALAAWYCDVLGFDHIFTPPGAVNPVFVRDESGCVIEFFAMPEGFSHPEDSVRKAQHLCLGVPDFDKAVEDLESKGVAFPEEGFSIFGDGKVRFFQDAEGNWIHLVYRTELPWS